MALASMSPSGVAGTKIGGRGRVLAAASLCAATLFFSAANAQDTEQNPAQNTAVDVVASRLNDSLSREMFATFNLFIYIDKAERGPFAERMFVFQKSGDNLALLYDWPVSTGREDLERDAHGHLETTITPVGYFELDPKRMYEDHVSSQWNEEMPYAMFFDWKPNGHETGLAIHGAAGETADELGTRASAGCVRLSEDNAHTLFDLVHGQFRGSAPKLAYLDGQDVSSEGFLLHDEQGQLQFRDGYSVLVVVDDFVGGDSRVSSLF
ncbi:MAG TPA: L,D-transpeptidase [Rhizomicrobium sp.]|nr:L,D-transpeptidase [Rhizomicrobium sp.]